eukprot:350410-Chlamydomonas_euryale.AAC.2
MDMRKEAPHRFINRTKHRTHSKCGLESTVSTMRHASTHAAEAVHVRRHVPEAAETFHPFRPCRALPHPKP